MHNLTKAGGPMLNQVINELAVMPLPLPGDDTGSGAQPVQANVSGGGVGVNGGAAAVQLRPATPEEQRYATELLTRLLDMGFMRQIGLAKRRMAQLPDGEEKITSSARSPAWKPPVKTSKPKSTATPLASNLSL